MVLRFTNSLLFALVTGGPATGGIQQVTVCGAPLDVLCDMLPVFELVERLVCLNVEDPQEVRLVMQSALTAVTKSASHLSHL